MCRPCRPCRPQSKDTRGLRETMVPSAAVRAVRNTKIPRVCGRHGVIKWRRLTRRDRLTGRSDGKGRGDNETPPKDAETRGDCVTPLLAGVALGFLDRRGLALASSHVLTPNLNFPVCTGYGLARHDYRQDPNKKNSAISRAEKQCDPTGLRYATRRKATPPTHLLNRIFRLNVR